MSVRELVLLPGWSMPAEIFAGVQRGLPSDINGRVLSVTMSAALESMALAALKQAPPAAIWCGHSLGGMIALQAALLAPERVSAVLVLAASPSFVVRDGWPHAMPKETLSAFAAGLNGDVDGTLARFDALQCRGGGTARADLRSMRALRSASLPGAADRGTQANGLALPPTSHTQDAFGLRAGLAALAASDLRAGVVRLACPVTWLFGEEDALVPVAVAREIRLLVPNAHVVTCAAANHLSGLVGDPSAVLNELNVLSQAASAQRC